MRFSDPSYITAASVRAVDQFSPVFGRSLLLPRPVLFCCARKQTRHVKRMEHNEQNVEIFDDSEV